MRETVFTEARRQRELPLRHRLLAPRSLGGMRSRSRTLAGAASALRTLRVLIGARSTLRVLIGARSTLRVLIGARSTLRVLGGASLSVFVEASGFHVRMFLRPPMMRASTKPRARAASSTPIAATSASCPRSPLAEDAERLREDRALLDRRDLVAEREVEPVVAARDAPPLLEVVLQVLRPVVRDDRVRDVSELVALRTNDVLDRGLVDDGELTHAVDERRAERDELAHLRVLERDAVMELPRWCTIRETTSVLSLSGTGRAPTMPTFGLSSRHWTISRRRPARPEDPRC